MQQYTRLKRPRILLLALLKIRATHASKHGIFPFELIFGRPMNLGQRSCSVPDLTESSHKHVQYFKGVLSSLEVLRHKVIRTLKGPPEVYHPYWLAQFVPKIVLEERCRAPVLEEPRQGLLVIHMGKVKGQPRGSTLVKWSQPQFSRATDKGNWMQLKEGDLANWGFSWTALLSYSW